MTDVTVPTPHGDLPVYLATPAGEGPWPGIVVIHDVEGMSADLRNQADWLATAGFLAAAPNLLSHGRKMRCLVRVMREAGAGSGRSFDEIDAIRRWLAEHPQCTGRIGVIGFCMGGGFALLLAPRGQFGVSSVNYGATSKKKYSADFLGGACPIVGSFGGKDPSLKGAAARLEAALTAVGVDHDVKEYSDASHAFINDHAERRLGPDGGGRPAHGGRLPRGVGDRCTAAHRSVLPQAPRGRGAAYRGVTALAQRSPEPAPPHIPGSGTFPRSSRETRPLDGWAVGDVMDQVGSDATRGIGDALSRMDTLGAALPGDLRAHSAFLDTYRRTTVAVGGEVEAGQFEDSAWVERWDVAFADLYLDAVEAQLLGGRVPRPWRLAFAAPASLPPLRHVLLGMNAHINYDLPQALLAVIDDADFTNPVLFDRRRRDHERIDAILVSRVGAENEQLAAQSTLRLTDRLLRPFNERASKRFLREARRKVWHNTIELQRARLVGPDLYAVRLGELEVLSAARIADLLAPGQVLLRLAVAGFGVVLPPEA